MSACAPSHPGHDASYDAGPGLDPGQQAEDAQLYRCVLHELIHLGTDFARILHLHATTQAQAALQGAAPSISPEGFATAFDRTARAIRRCIALARSLHDPVPVPDHAARPRDALPHPAPGRNSPEAPGAGLHDHTDAPGRDRDAPDRDEDDTGRPPAEVIADICRDLGLDAPPGAGPWTRPTPANAGQPCSCAAPGGAAAGSAQQPGSGPEGVWPQAPGPHEFWPQDARPSAAQPPPDPQPDEHDPGRPAATPRAQPGPIHVGPAQAGSRSPDDPASAVATIPRHSGQTDARWRPPPSG